MKSELPRQAAKGHTGIQLLVLRLVERPERPIVAGQSLIYAGFCHSATWRFLIVATQKTKNIIVVARHNHANASPIFR